MKIGDNVNIGADCIIMDTDCHNLDPEIRKSKEMMPNGMCLDCFSAKSSPITIEKDVLVAMDALKEGEVSKMIETESAIYFVRIDKDTDEEEYYTLVLSERLYEIYDTLIYECEDEIKSSQNHVDKNLAEFDLRDDLYATNPKSNYSSYVGLYLDSIYSYEDIGNNRDTILDLFERDALLYLITGKSVDDD